MNNQFGNDQHGQRNQETNVRLDVVEKWDRNCVAERMT